jgi:hypothetical protein
MAAGLGKIQQALVSSQARAIKPLGAKRVA